MSRILVSRCLTGDRCLYHGGRATLALDTLAALSPCHEIVPVCAEMLGGLPCPRPPARRRAGRVWAAGVDVTGAFELGAGRAMEAAGCVDLAILLAQSPSCDPAHGILGRRLSAAGIPCVAASRFTNWRKDLARILAALNP